MTQPAPRILNRADKTLDQWGRLTTHRNKSAFEQGGHQQHGGPRWAVRKRNKPWPILNRTGRLKNSIRWKDDAAGKGAILTKVPYAKFHHFGTDNLPVRKVTVVSSRDIEGLKRNLKRDLKQEYESGV